MNDPVSRHPGAETMAAFLEGRLAPHEVAEVAAHLRDCADCRTVTGEAARFEAEEAGALAADQPVHRPLAVRWRAWAAAAAAAVAAVSTPLLMRPTPIATLIDASPGEYRRVQGRLSGFPWARLQGAARGTAAAEHELQGAAHEVLAKTTNDEAVKARHAAGVAHLLIDQTAESLDKLADAARESEDARIWNDLAAARYTVAVREGGTELYSSALDAVNRSLQLDPDLADAHFNRALILEGMNLKDAARQQWRRYLELDPSSDWSNEAREHLRALGEPAADLDFPKELARAARDRGAIVALVRRFPQDARTTGETHLLGEWGDAYVANDAARAEEKLAVVRAIAEELAASRGERLLLDAVRTIERTPDAVAEAHRRHRDGRVAFDVTGKRRLTEASEAFREAETMFRRAGSPFADVAALYVAKCASDQSHDATGPLTALRARVDSTRYRALAAEIDWALARQAASAADWGTAARIAAAASDTFAQLGELRNAAWMNVLGANALEREGAVQLAWQRRISAFSAYDTPGQQRRVATILHAAAVGLAASDHVSAAAAVMDLAIAAPSHPELRGTILTDRARLAERTGDLTAARRWLSEARDETKRIADRRLREDRFVQLELTDAVLRRATNPLQALAALDRSVAWFEKHRQGIYLSDALLERARTHRAAGRTDDAAADYRAALQEIDRQRENAGSVSVAFLDVAARAIDESIDLHLERREVAEAFAIADRAHAMRGRDYRPAALPDGVAVLEYMVLPRAVAIFCVTRDGIVAKKVALTRAELESRVSSFTRKIRGGADVTADAKELHALLIAPVAGRLANVRELVIVPDRQLNVLPFRALHDGERYLIETYTVRVAPSAAASKQGAAAQQGGTVVIGDPASDRAPRLPSSRDEATAVAALYRVSPIVGRDATRARVAEAIASSALVHYAGHADSNAASYGALLLAPGRNDSDLLTAHEIARLDLRARPLVVLSACGTLRGRTTHVAGTPSVARAFLGAGARAVVGTLWEVEDDVIAPLLLRFHEHVLAGEVPAGALRAAQLEMLQSSDPRRRHPSAWSAVEVLSNL